MGVTEILYSFRLVLEGKTDKEISVSSRLEFLEEFSANYFADAVENISRLLKRGGTADLSLLRTILAICPKLWEPCFWEVMDDSFILLAYASLAAARTLS